MTAEQRKPRTLRLPAELDDQLTMIAKVAGVSVNTEIMDAIENQIAARRKDEKFMARLAERLKRDAELYERLGQ